MKKNTMRFLMLAAIFGCGFLIFGLANSAEAAPSLTLGTASAVIANNNNGGQGVSIPLTMNGNGTSIAPSADTAVSFGTTITYDATSLGNPRIMRTADMAAPGVYKVFILNRICMINHSETTHTPCSLDEDCVDYGGGKCDVHTPGSLIVACQGMNVSSSGNISYNNYLIPNVKIADLTFDILDGTATSGGKSIDLTNLDGTTAISGKDANGNDLDNSIEITPYNGTITLTGTAQHATYNIDDFGRLVQNWLSAPTTTPTADVNAIPDNLVNARDLGIMMSYWRN